MKVLEVHFKVKVLNWIWMQLSLVSKMVKNYDFLKAYYQVCLRRHSCPKIVADLQFGCFRPLRIWGEIFLMMSKRFFFIIHKKGGSSWPGGQCVEAETALPDFSWYNIPKREKIYQNDYYVQTTLKCTKWQWNRQNWHKMYQHFSLSNTPKFTQIGIFCLKIYHLATLARESWLHSSFLEALRKPVSERQFQNTRPNVGFKIRRMA
jgi:hypothetical protein